MNSSRSIIIIVMVVRVVVVVMVLLFIGMEEVLDILQLAQHGPILARFLCPRIIWGNGPLCLAAYLGNTHIHDARSIPQHIGSVGDGTDLPLLHKMRLDLPLQVPCGGLVGMLRQRHFLGPRADACGKSGVGILVLFINLLACVKLRPSSEGIEVGGSG